MSERLTQPNAHGGYYFPRCFEPPCIGEGSDCCACDVYEQVAEKLGRYEDTGREPEEIVARFDKPTTGDKMRGMSDDDLADVIYAAYAAEDYPNYICDGLGECSDDGCDECTPARAWNCILRWLKKPTK